MNFVRFILRAKLLSTLLISVRILAAQTAAHANTNAIIADLRAGNYDNAHRQIDAALKASPDDATLWGLDGFALVHLGDEKAALASYQHALKLSPNYLPALEGAAQIEYQSAGQSAVPLLDKIVAIRPNDETSHAMLATLAFERRDCKTATEHFRQSPTLTASKAVSLDQYGTCLLELGQTEEALKVFEHRSELEPGSDKGRYNLAVAQVMAKRYPDAIATLNPLLKRKPDDGDYLDVLADAYEGELNTPDAVASLRKAITKNPSVEQYYLDFADLCLAHASYQVGIDVLNAGLQRLPKSAPLYLARGILYVQLDNYERSRDDFQKAEELDPQLEYGHGIQGLADLQLSHLTEAEKDVRSRLNKAPNDAFLWYMLGETIARGGATAGSPQFAEAVRADEKALQLRPDFPLARNLLAKLYLAEGKTQDAIKQSRLAYEEDPTGETAPTALYHLMTALRKAGQRDEIPALAHKLTEIREQQRAKETAERRYALVEAGSSTSEKR